MSLEVSWSYVVVLNFFENILVILQHKYGSEDLEYLMIMMVLKVGLKFLERSVCFKAHATIRQKLRQASN